MHNQSQIIRLLAAAVVLSLPVMILAELAVWTPNPYAWSPNTGFQNWQGDGLTAGFRMNSQFAYGWGWDPNVGWIHFGDGSPNNGYAYSNTSVTDYGVNSNPIAIPGHFRLSGFAWSPNTGWINFETQAQGGLLNQPRVDRSSLRLEGMAWSANLGWISLENVTLAAFPDGVPSNEVAEWADYE